MGTNTKRNSRGNKKLNPKNTKIKRLPALSDSCCKSSGTEGAGPYIVTVREEEEGNGKVKATSTRQSPSPIAGPALSINSVMWYLAVETRREVTVSCPQSLILRRPSPHPQHLGKGQDCQN